MLRADEKGKCGLEVTRRMTDVAQAEADLRIARFPPRGHGIQQRDRKMLTETVGTSRRGCKAHITCSHS